MKHIPWISALTVTLLFIVYENSTHVTAINHFNTVITYDLTIFLLNFFDIIYIPLEPYQIMLDNGFKARIADECNILLPLLLYIIMLSYYLPYKKDLLVLIPIAWFIMTLLNVLRILFILVATAYDLEFFEIYHNMGRLMTLIMVVGLFYFTITINQKWRAVTYR